MHDTLRRWNELSDADAKAQVLPCNGSDAWTQRLVQGRPYSTPVALYQASDAAWQDLSEAERQQAYATHPRIGERHAIAAGTTSLSWSAQEQAAAEHGAPDELERLAAGNRAYEARFNRTYLICATGKLKPEILLDLEARLHRTDEQEQTEAAEQQRQITRLRLQRWLEGS